MPSFLKSIFGILLVGATAQCPTGWTDTGTFCYGLVGSSLTASAAEQSCLSYHPASHLTPIINDQEAALVVDNCAFSGLATHYWIGLEDLTGSTGWAWKSGSSTSFILSSYAAESYWYGSVIPSISTSRQCVSVNSGIVTVTNCNSLAPACCRVSKTLYASRTPTRTRSSTRSPTASMTATRTRSSTASQTATRTRSSTHSPTRSQTATWTRSSTRSMTASVTPTSSITTSSSMSITPTSSISISLTPTASISVSPTSSLTPTSSQTPTSTRTITITPTRTRSRSGTPWPYIWADSYSDLIDQQGSNGWTWGFEAGVLRQQFTSYGTNPLNGKLGWYLAGTYAQIGKNYIMPNALNCRAHEVTDIVPTLKWTNSGKWPAQEINIYFEFYNAATCGDGVSVMLYADNNILYMNDNFDSRIPIRANEYYTLGHLSELELFVSGGETCQCDGSNYRIIISPSYVNGPTQHPTVTPTTSPIVSDDEWYDFNDPELSPTASGSVTASATASASSSASGSSSPSSSYLFETMTATASVSASISSSALSTILTTATITATTTFRSITLIPVSVQATVSPSSLMSSTPNIIYYNDNDINITGLASDGFYGAIFGSIVGLLGLCIMGFGLDKSSHDKFLIELKKNKQLVFIQKTYDSNLFSVSNYYNVFGWLNIFKIPTITYSISNRFIGVLINNRFFNWICEFNPKYWRISRLLTIGISILSIQFFIGLMFSGDLVQGYGWLAGFIGSILYIPVVLIVDFIAKYINIIFYRRKYIGIAGEEKSIIEFERSITKDFINNILDDMYQYQDAIKSFIDVSKLGDIVDLMKQIVMSDIKVFSNRILEILYDKYNICVSGLFGLLFGWSIWCSVYFIKYVCSESVDKGIFVIKSTAWAIILIVIIIEPIMYLIRRKYIKDTMSLSNNFIKLIASASHKSSICYYDHTCVPTTVSLHADAIKVLYYIYKNINKYREEKEKGDSKLHIIDGNQIINISEIITETH